MIPPSNNRDTDSPSKLGVVLHSLEESVVSLFPTRTQITCPFKHFREQIKTNVYYAVQPTCKKRHFRVGFTYMLYIFILDIIFSRKSFVLILYSVQRSDKS